MNQRVFKCNCTQFYPVVFMEHIVEKDTFENNERYGEIIEAIVLGNNTLYKITKSTKKNVSGVKIKLDNLLKHNLLIKNRKILGSKLTYEYSLNEKEFIKLIKKNNPDLNEKNLSKKLIPLISHAFSEAKTIFGNNSQISLESLSNAVYHYSKEN